MENIGIFSKLIAFTVGIINKITNYIGLTFNDIFCLFIIFMALSSFYILHKKVRQNIKMLGLFIKQIEGLSGNMNEKLIKLNDENILKNDMYLYNLWKRYFKNLRESGIEESVTDISKYFNKATIIDIPGKRKIAEIIPGVLTALGILGTFLGLLNGISGLNTQNIETMRNGINTLLNGMSLAFTTSIVGILSSIIWSWLDRKSYKRYIEMLNNFYIIFTEQFPITNSLNFLNEIVLYQKEQTEAIKHISTDISLEIAKAFNKTVSETLIPKIDESIGMTLKENVLPAINSMSDVIKDFANVATSNQTDGLNKIVEKFVVLMNESLNGQFENLANTIDELCKWQIETKNNLEKLINELEETARNQKEINVSSEEMIKHFSAYFEKLIEANNNIDKSINVMENIVSNMNELVQYNKEITIEIEEKQKLLNQRNDMYIKTINQCVEELNSNWNSMQSNLEEINLQLENATKTFIENMHKGLEITFQDFDKNLAHIVNRLSGTINEIQETIDEMPRLLRATSERFSHSLETVNKTVLELDKVFTRIKSEYQSA
ncbi:MotA/TolQ/ExbB proton channel family protein [Caloranaerobacter sp. DY30410]|uniref:MotA/TolQ/ExbB proton channel family protein n=1 Tax=Caloranaerobacter sp. DY30410 TaxID=3238305 RepID=UPI003D02C7CE